MRLNGSETGTATRARILAAAERAFAEKGLDGPTLRAITVEAGANVAAVNYHFGSKDGLAQAVFVDLSRRVNDERTAALDALEREAAENRQPPELERIVEILIRPYASDEPGGRLLVRLIMQHRAAPSELTRRIVATHFDPFAQRLIAALAAALPDLPKAEVYWRYHFSLGALLFAFADTGANNRLAMLSQGLSSAADREELLAHLVPYICSALRAPPLARRRANNRRKA